MRKKDRCTKGPKRVVESDLAEKKKKTEKEKRM